MIRMDVTSNVTLARIHLAYVVPRTSPSGTKLAAKQSAPHLRPELAEEDQIRRKKQLRTVRFRGSARSTREPRRINRAFPNVATVPTVSQRGLCSQVIGSDYGDGWDAAHRLATQNDGIDGSNVGQKAAHGRRDSDNATTRVKVTPNGTWGSPIRPSSGRGLNLTSSADRFLPGVISR
jgi:hypothetical protein